MRQVVLAVLVVILSSGCSIVSVSPVRLAEVCPAYQLTPNVWSFHLFPYVMQEKAVELMNIAKSRDTHKGTDPSGYRGDAFSRTLGPTLRKEDQGKASVDLFLEAYYLDPETTYVMRYLGRLYITGDTGSMILPDDPREWIVETIWPENFLSPISSGGGHRLWLFGEEWKDHCRMNIHGLVP